MKKAFLIIIAVLVILAAIGAVAWHYAPRIAFYLAGKAMGGSIEAKESHVTYRNGGLVLALKGVTAKGTVEGRIERCEAEFLLRKGIYIRRLVISDFDVAIRGERKSLKFYPIPVESAEIGKGMLTYGGRRYTIREVKVSDFNTGKTLRFSIDAGAEGLGNIKTHGEGIFGGEKRSDIKGEYFLSRVDMAKVLKHYEGLTDSRGTFSYRKGTLTVDGQLYAPYFSIWETFFLARLGQKDSQGHIHLTRTGEIIDVTLTGLRFRETPLSLRFTTRQKDLLYLELKTEFMPIPELLKYIDLAQFADQDWDPFSHVTKGEVRIDRLVFEKKKPLAALIDLRKATVGDERVLFEDVTGSLRVDGVKVVLSGFAGRYRESRMSEVRGVIPLKADLDLDVKGKYAADLRDIEEFYKPDGIGDVAGLTEGEFELKGHTSGGFRVVGAGAMHNGRLTARGVPLHVAGEYRFDSDSIEFRPLHITSSGTDLRVAGRIERGSLEISGKGVVNSRHLVLASIIPSRYHLNGPLGIDGAIEKRNGSLSIKGDLAMTDLAFEAPGFMKKPSGVESAATVSIRADQEKGDTHIDRLDLALGIIRAQATGRIDRGGVAEGHLLLDAPAIERASRLFFFDTLGAKGDLKADLTFSDLRYPIERLPAIQGSLVFRNGTIHLPFMAEPIRAIRLDCGFFGDRFALDVGGLKVGNSIMEKGRLNVEGLERPSFDLQVEMGHFDAHDFRNPVKKTFRLPVIGKGTLMSRASGLFSFSSRTVKIQETTGKDVVLKGEFGRSSISLRDGRMKTETGSVSITGSASLESPPKVRMTAELRDIDAAKALALAGGKGSVIEGKGSVSADLRFVGREEKDLLASATGNVKITSQKGVIKRWNLISKLLALTNVYDLFRGRVDLTQRGLSYNRLSTTLEGQNGVFQTSNFLIDSPSMIITGRGTIDVGGKTVDGRMLVSPLVMLDRVIDWIPLIRNVFREKKTGVLFFIYDVRGSMDDPEISSSYVESMGTRVFNIFKNAVRLPKDVLELLPKEKLERELLLEER